MWMWFGCAAGPVSVEPAAPVPTVEVRPFVRRLDAESVGLDPAALDAFVDRAYASRSDAVILWKDGHEVLHWPPSPKPIETMSATKSVVGLAVAWLVQEGHLEGEQVPVASLLPAMSDHPEVTVGQVVRNVSGLAAPPTNEVYGQPDFVAFAADLEAKALPGAVFAYNNAAYNLLPEVVLAAAGEPIDTVLGEGLFAALGVTETRWSSDPTGHRHGMSGLAMTADDLLKLGQLLVDDGVWEGERLLGTETLALLGSPTGGYAPYGFGWWRMEQDGELVGLRADGYLGQHLVVLFEPRVVAVRQMGWYPGADERDHFVDFHQAVAALVDGGSGRRSDPDPVAPIEPG